MPRRGSISKRDVLPDPLYNSKLVTKLVNNVMYDGKKGVAQTIVYDAFSIIADKTARTPWKFSRPRLTISSRSWRSRRAASAVRPIRSRWTCAPTVSRRLLCVG